MRHLALLAMALVVAAAVAASVVATLAAAISSTAAASRSLLKAGLDPRGRRVSSWAAAWVLQAFGYADWARGSTISVLRMVVDLLDAIMAATSQQHRRQLHHHHNHHNQRLQHSESLASTRAASVDAVLRSLAAVGTVFCVMFLLLVPLTIAAIITHSNDDSPEAIRSRSLFAAAAGGSSISRRSAAEHHAADARARLAFASAFHRNPRVRRFAHHESCAICLECDDDSKQNLGVIRQREESASATEDHRSQGNRLSQLYESGTRTTRNEKGSDDSGGLDDPSLCDSSAGGWVETVRCGHGFHATCINKWIVASTQELSFSSYSAASAVMLARCPMCQTRFISPQQTVTVSEQNQSILAVP